MVKQSTSKTELVECPDCHQRMRADQLGSHKVRVHSKAAPASRYPPTPPGQRMCPVCKGFVPSEGYKEHLVRCMWRAKRKARNEAKPAPPLRPPQETSRVKYITDEFGVVHTYDEWFENETLGDHTEVEPSVEKRTIQRIKQQSSSPQVGRATHRASGAAPNPVWITCDICGARLLPQNLERHRQKVHPKPASGDLEIPSPPNPKPSTGRTTTKPPSKSGRSH